ncbi:MAG: acyltransferase family protein [Cyanobacteria bacterium P01_F01_bin.150]
MGFGLTDTWLCKAMRHYDFDWIRNIIIINLIPLHVTWLMIFIPDFSQVSTTSLTALLLKGHLGFVSSWHMPMLFLIAGYSAAASLSKRSIRRYYVERVQRLLVPLITFMVTLGPIQRYFWPTYLGHRNLTDFATNHLPIYFGTLLNGSCGAYRWGPRWDHLWFIAYLFVINITALAILIRINRSRIVAIANSLRRHIVLLPMIGFGGIMATLGYRWPLFNCQTLFQDWGYFSYNLWAFVIGYLMYAAPHLNQAIREKSRLWYVLFFVSSIIRFVFLNEYQEGFYEDHSSLGRYLFFSALTGIHTWSAISTVLTLAYRYLAKTTNPCLNYLSKASLPIYILHYPISIILGSYITALGLKIIPEFLVMNAFTVLFTLLIYELLIKPWPLVQRLLGMKPRKNQP